MADPRALTVSAAVTSTNAVRYLGDQIDSILAQTRLPDQVVVADAGSTDGSQELVRAYVERTRAAGLPVEWTILPSQPTPLDANMARTYAACTGDVVVVCDHDDVCLPDRFAHAVEMFAARPELLLVHCEAEIVDSDGATVSTSMLRTEGVTADELAQYRAGEGFRVLVRRFLAHGATAALRRDLLDLVPPVPHGFRTDAWLALLAAATGGVALDERPGLRYRTHPTNTSGGVRRRGVGEKLRMLREPGGERNARLLARAEALVAGLDAIRPHVQDWAYELAVDNLRHERVRSRYPRNRLLRAPHVLRTASGGAYDRLARGRKDVLLDLLQPIG
ncbi:glycosyltransferase [Cellulomonas sp. JZ18]|uniref:glycosyltransferase n=1 Tax=Cellulomonas sp. JZ18 TaxID=2654191 RepID=UPI0018AF9EC3|nr:glycosyltransferase [Cellulomonas sp. JZ18]